MIQHISKLPSINIRQQNINASGTKYQPIFNSCFPLNNINKCVLEAHQQYSKFKRLH